MTENVIRMTGIKKIYNVGDEELEVLKGVDFVLNKGEFASIMGESGSGKSTLMNIIGMLDNPTTGNYFFNGVDISKSTDDEQALLRRRNIGFIFQSYNLLSKTTALRQVMLPLVYQGVPAKLRKQLAIEALTKVGLKDKINSLPSEMSGGQQQRVAIARAIVTDPLLILGDEPTGALDSKTGSDVMEIIAKLNEEGKTILIITHSAEVDKFAKKHIFIKDGMIV
ncbi:MAG: ABC transporter ATP-binding protein [Candidatus Gracilibacteria bacterium]|nr:ABC transporter ATP-binding protein [Candidatus Gracilibacteria bacterium]MDD2908916.1 ABC transporter ATP-binding protein [Candidatus Gracilibacteria bacterium]